MLALVQAFVLANDAVATQQLLRVLHAGFGQVHLALLFVDPVIAVAVFLFLAHEARHEAVDLDVELRRFVGRTGNDQRRARLVDQDRVDLVDDGELQGRAGALSPCDCAMLSRR